MPRQLLSPFGKRQPRALVVGLRRVVKDPKATVAQRLEACRILAIVEGFIEDHGKDRVQSEAKTSRTPQTTTPPPTNPQNAIRLRELLESARTTA
jgi:hypothetical protein